MNLQNAFARLELPLLKRELIENSQKKRTYVLRVLLAAVLILILLVFYVEEIVQRSNLMEVLGRGHELAGVLLVANLFAVYALLPAIACSAITAERERQTLTLLLISRISPVKLILEKVLSRIVPMLVLLLITAPMLAICYVLGGTSLQMMSAALIIIFTATLQAASAAILCSALFRTTVEAFWASYVLLTLMAVGPPILDEFNLMPDIRWVSGFPSHQQTVLFTMFLAGVEFVFDGHGDLSDVVLAALPALVTATAMLVISGVSVARYRESSPLSTRTLAAWFHAVLSFCGKLLRSPFEFKRRLLSQGSNVRTTQRPERALPINEPIAWREIGSTMLARWSFVFILCGLIVLGEIWAIADSRGRSWIEDYCVFIDMTTLIVALLVVVTVSCRAFASERDRQSLDLLLTTPVANRDLLMQKLAAANRSQLLLLVPLLFTAAWHVFLSDFRPPPVDAFGQYHSHGTRSAAYPLSSEWLWGIFRYLFGFVAHCLVYMSIAKWTAVFFSLRLNSLMKSLIGTLLSLVALCVVPILCFLIPMLLARMEPDDFPLFIFSSPIAVLIVAEYHDLHIVFARSSWPDSEYSVLLFNLLIYGGIAVILRTIIVRRLPRFLNRVD